MCTYLHGKIYIHVLPCVLMHTVGPTTRALRRKKGCKGQLNVCVCVCILPRS